MEISLFFHLNFLFECYDTLNLPSAIISYNNMKLEIFNVI